MRNLYEQLNIAVSASIDEIRQAIAAVGDESLKTDARAVLLEPARRYRYDRVNNALRMIGCLRSAFDLSSTYNWRDEERTAYRFDMPKVAAYEAFLRKIEQRNSEAAAQSSESGGGAGRWWWVAGLAFLGWMWWSNSSDHAPEAVPEPASTSYSGSSRKPATRSSFNQPALALPASGSLHRYINARGVAPFQIKTSDNTNFLVRLANVTTGEKVMDVFVRGGNTVEVSVPLGTYVVKYASGKTWYGYPYLFGPQTQYNKAETTFRFHYEGQRVVGYTVTLYQVVNGNMETSRLPASQF